MKKIITLKNSTFLFAALFAILFSSCSSQPESLKVIPKEAYMVSSFNLYNMAKKGGLESISDFDFFKEMQKELKNEDKKASKKLKKYIENPLKLGINFKEDFFYYFSNEDDDEEFFVVTMDLISGDNFQEFFEDVLSLGDEGYDIEEEDNYKYILLDDEVLLAWDDDKAIFVFAYSYKSRENIEDFAEDIFSLKEDEQITDLEAFNSFYENRKDIGFYVSSNILENVDKRAFKEMEELTGYSLEDNTISFNLSFEEGAIRLLGNIAPNEDLHAEYEKSKEILDRKFNNKLLNFMPKNSLVAASMAGNPEKMYKRLKENKEFKEFEKQIEEEIFVDLKEIFENLEGSVIFSLSDIDKKEIEYMAYGYRFNESEAIKLDMEYKIEDASTLTEKDIERLNNGEAIRSESNSSYYGDQYFFDIKNILANGGDYQSALQNGDVVNWYKGGGEYGKFIPSTKEELIPNMALAFDLNDNQVIEEMLDEIPEDALEEKNNYYQIETGEFPIYIAYDKEACLISTDLKTIKGFKKGGLNNNLSQNEKVKNNCLEHYFYFYSNVNLEDYPKEFSKEIMPYGRTGDTFMDMWNAFAQDFEMKQKDIYNFEMKFNLNDKDENSLKSIFNLFDSNYKDLMRI